MSVVIHSRWLQCDGPDCVEASTYFRGARCTATALRRAAKKAGWLRANTGDFCSEECRSAYRAGEGESDS